MEKKINSNEDKENEDRRNLTAFKEEAVERLAELEAALLDLEDSPTDQKLIDSAFRAMHTIKGSGGMFGFEEIVEFTHDIETVFDKVRDGSIPVTKELIALTLSAHDQIGKLLNHLETPVEEDIEKRKEISGAFLKYLPQNKVGASELERPKTAGVTKDPSIYRIRFKPSAELFNTGTNPLLLLNELKELGHCRIIGHVGKIDILESLDPETCYTWWDIILSTRESLDEIRDIFIFVDEICDIKIDEVEVDAGLDYDESNKRLGEILVERGDLGKEQLQKVLESKVLFGQQLQKDGLVQPSQVESALTEQKFVQEAKEQKRKIDSVSSIRVSSTKLDLLVNLVGELVTAQARLSQVSSTRDDATITSIAEEIERLTTELRDNTMSVRMLTIGTTFAKFKRLVRDLSSDLDKKMNLVTEGEETELDKNVIEQLNDPLVHLLRNAADHGIEPSEVRLSAGKEKEGTIKLSAGYSGAQVIIKIEDDGAGMDPKFVHSKAVEKGLISKDASLSDKECFALIFEPGFSTAKSVTNVSGRGVGMDVVKKAIENLRGTVDVDSQLGQGTTITIRLPLTLAIIDGLLVKVAEEFFVIPLSSVEGCIDLTEYDLQQSHGRNITNVRGQIVPYIRLREQFNIGGKRPAVEQVVITEIDDHRVGFVVDNVIGQHQTVIKNLSKVYKKVDTVSGATIMADGTVALIIDINKHFQLVEKEYQKQYA